MASRSHTQTSFQDDKVSQNYPAIDAGTDGPVSTRHSIEDVIVSLANAYENKRARQVVEWETLFRKGPSDQPGRVFF